MDAASLRHAPLPISHHFHCVQRYCASLSGAISSTRALLLLLLFKLGTQTEDEDPHHQQAPWLPRSRVKVAKLRDASDRCWPISRERNVLETPKLVGRLYTPRAIKRTCFEVKGQRSKVKVAWPTNAETRSASYLPNGKAYELQTWYTNEGRRLASSTGAVTSKVKGQGRQVTWCIWQVLTDKSKTKHPSNTKIGRKVVHSTGNNAHQSQGQMSKIKVTRPTNAHTKGKRSSSITAETKSVSYLPKGRFSNSKTGTPIEHALYQLPRQLKRPMKLSSCTRAEAYRVGRTRRPRSLFFLLLFMEKLD